jgi:[acyl-carrier-protein] S-malonyltransferase
MKTAFIFPGQGAQYAGMGKELYEQYDEVRDAFKEAAEATGRNVWAMCQDADGAMLSHTGFVQSAIVALEAALSRLLMGRFGVKPQAASGLSLGEYAALQCAGALSFAEAVRLADFRGRLMEECGSRNPGAMAAVMGAGRAEVEDACIRARAEGQSVWPCNYNCPGQVVIGGTKEGVERGSQIALAVGARRVLPLKVSGAFHTPLMATASDAFKPALMKAKFGPAAFPVYSNVNARPHGDNIRDAMAMQIISPVLWEDILRAMADCGVDTFIELGPGKTLAAFVKKTVEGVACLNVEDAESLKKTLEFIEGGR